jgi:hypothetical protein
MFTILLYLFHLLHKILSVHIAAWPAPCISGAVTVTKCWALYRQPNHILPLTVSYTCYVKALIIIDNFRGCTMSQLPGHVLVRLTNMAETSSDSKSWLFPSPPHSVYLSDIYFSLCFHQPLCCMKSVLFVAVPLRCLFQLWSPCILVFIL